MGLPPLADSMASPDLQIWNNAAFDDGSASKTTPSHPPPPVRSVSTNPCGSSLDLDPSKENRSPDSAKPLAAQKKPAARVAFRDDDKSIDEEIGRIEGEIAGLQSRLDALRVKKAENSSTAAEAVGRMRGRIVPAKFMDPKQGTPPMPASKRMEPSPVASAGLRRRGLSLGPLEILATPAKSLDPKRNAAKNLWPSALKKKNQESPAPSAKVDRRGLSLGPLEIHESFTLDQPHKASGTPLRSVQSCKKPSSQKLRDSKEGKGATKERGKSLSPKPRPPATAKKTASDAKKAAETPATVRLRQRSVSLGPAEIASSARSCRPNNPHQDREKATKTDKLPRRGPSMSPKSRQPSTTAAKKPAKEDQTLGGVRPKALFQENSSTSSCKRPSKTAKARVVPSRYSLASTRTVGDEPGCKRRKWSLPELGKEKTRGPRRRSSGPALDCKRSQGSDLSEDQVMMDTEIPDNLEAEASCCPSSVQESPPSVMKIAETLPKIKTLRCNTESPRDSGCVKRAVELVGRKSYFAVAEGGEEPSSPCQALNFHEHM